MASMSAGNLTRAKAALVKVLEASRKNAPYKLASEDYEAVRQMSVASAVTY